MLILGHFTALASIISAKKILGEKKVLTETIDTLILLKVFKKKKKEKVKIVKPDDSQLGNQPGTGYLKETKRCNAYHWF